jgi:hypothetical protein
MTDDVTSDSEFSVEIGNGNTIRTDTYDTNPAGASYVRVCGPDGTEFAYWAYEEWEADPQLVMGAFLAAAGNPPDTPTVD